MLAERGRGLKESKRERSTKGRSRIGERRKTKIGAVQMGGRGQRKTRGRRWPIEEAGPVGGTMTPERHRAKVGEGQRKI